MFTITEKAPAQRRMGRKLTDGGLLRYRNESPNNWEMLSNKGVGTADQWEHGTATQQPITQICSPDVVDCVYLQSGCG